jgi:YVTN family beta-propeller protein
MNVATSTSIRGPSITRLPPIYGFGMNPRDLLIHASVAGLLAAGVATAATTISSLADSGGGTRSVYVPIAPCRLADTRPGTDNVGTRSTPLAQTEVHTFQVWGTNGNCTIPASATGIGTNVTAVNPTADGYLTVYPADVERPLASNLNWTPTSPPTPNQVTVGLSATGAVSAYNNGGTIDIIIDIVGFYETLPPTGTGPQGPQGPQGPAGPANRLSDTQIAQLRWDQDPGRAATFATDTNPRGIAFDGENIWIASYQGKGVSKMNRVTGDRTDYVTGSGAQGVVFDGTSIWVTNYSSNNVSKVNPATGAKVDYPTGTHPFGIAFDGTSIWIVNNGSNNVSKMDPATGTKTDYAVGLLPYGIAYDGTSIWVANYSSNTVSKINPATGTKVDYNTGAGPDSVAYDGTSIWITNYSVASVSRMNPATGAKVDFPTGNSPQGIAYDGTSIWVANHFSNSVSKINPVTGSKTDYPTGTIPTTVAYDGTNIWVANLSANTVSKILPG